MMTDGIYMSYIESVCLVDHSRKSELGHGNLVSPETEEKDA